MKPIANMKLCVRRKLSGLLPTFFVMTLATAAVGQSSTSVNLYALEKNDRSLSNSFGAFQPFVGEVTTAQQNFTLKVTVDDRPLSYVTAKTFAYNTGIMTPGAHRVDVSLCEAGSSNVIERITKDFVVQQNVKILQAAMIANVREVTVGKSQSLMFQAQIANGSNVSADFTVEYKLLKPDGTTVAASESKGLTVKPQEAAFPLDFTPVDYGFDVPGDYRAVLKISKSSDQLWTSDFVIHAGSN
ncbi:MAG: hypothetical protein HY360_22070 [Verrucomicrobia bacterium]|nr:hypothetical protein [Verrucomicrobiota bacterium]